VSFVCRCRLHGNSIRQIRHFLERRRTAPFRNLSPPKLGGRKETSMSASLAVLNSKGFTICSYDTAMLCSQLHLNTPRITIVGRMFLTLCQASGDILFRTCECDARNRHAFFSFSLLPLLVALTRRFHCPIRHLQSASVPHLISCPQTPRSSLKDDCSAPYSWTRRGLASVTPGSARH